jgi:predicted lipoprotein
MKNLKYVTINGKKWQVVNRTLEINKLLENSKGKSWQVTNEFVARLAGFIPKVETNTEYGVINPTAWGEEII